MEAWQWVLAVHWVIYIASFVAFGVLFTRFRKWGALWIGSLFLIQALWQGCPVVSLENYFRVREGLLPLENGLLTDRFGTSLGLQLALSYLTAFCAFALALIEQYA